jgi:3-oxoadipate enol-lactonase
MDQFATTPAGTLRYRVDGPADAPAVLMSNSLGTTLELWDGQVEEWSRRYRVIRYDTRGHGKSSVGRTLSGPPEYTIDELGRDALAVLDAAGATTAHVCGISLGGLTAMWLGVNAPDRVDALIVANTAAKVGTAERWTERVGKLRGEGMGAMADLARTNWFTEAFRREHPAVVQRYHTMVASCPPDGYAGCCAALRDADLREAIKGIRARTLVIGGDQDPSTPLSGSEEIQRSIAGARLVVFPCAHLSNVERAAEFTEQGGAFLG